jgi:hypothetical protein
MEIIDFYEHQNFATIKQSLVNHGVLFEDEHFPADIRSLFIDDMSSTNFLKDNIGNLINASWRRPFQIFENPQLIVNGFSRKDIHQGLISDCWFVAALTSVATRPEYLNIVIPQDQSFDRYDYCGMFHFRFWRFGKWYDVVIDDRLPYDEKRQCLLFCKNEKQSNELWTCLIEKAYAKFVGCYELLENGYSHGKFNF